MNKNTWCIIICSVLSVAFLATGLWMLHLNAEKKAGLEAAVAQEQGKLSQYANADAQLAAAQKEKQAIEESISALEAENARLDEEATQLQQEYDKLAQDENNIYLMTILESLQKGMKKVEEYINGTK